MSLFVSRSKPNPSGKDRFGHLSPAVQLAGEWVDLHNNTSQGISLSNLELHHIAYTATHPNGIWERAYSFQGMLPAGCTLRVHSGGEIPVNQMYQIDINGAEYHAFTGLNYIWNNNRSDTPRLWNVTSRTVVDQATYGAYPQEGRILIRRGDHLL